MSMLFSSYSTDVKPYADYWRQCVWPSPAARGVDVKAVSPVAGQQEVRPSLVPFMSPSSRADRNWRMLDCFPVPSTA